MPKLASISLLLFLLSSGLQSIVCEEPWRFINFADYHGGEEFVLKPVMEAKEFQNMSPKQQKKFAALEAIKQDYGGELVVIPGDTNSGKWFEEKLVDDLNVKNRKKAIKKAGKRSYQSLKFFFGKAGWDKMFVAVGDHELGGNSWPAGNIKTNLMPRLRSAFANNMNFNEDGQFLYRKPIGTATSRPLGTSFASTSYAVQHKNVMFITVDAFKKLPENYVNKKRGAGGEGSVTCTVTGEHLKWFTQVLRQSRKDPSIHHIIVQAHLPILQPVRKAYSSGQFMDFEAESPFWLAMREFEVDVYFAGEVHQNTATKDDDSNLVQVVSRGNGASNFLAVDVTDDSILITSYKEYGPDKKFNVNFEEQGSLLIDKSGADTKIKSEGNLLLLDRTKPVIHLSFDEKVPLTQRQQTVLKHDDEDKTLLQSKVTVRGVECSTSFINYGSFGQDYDALTAKVQLSYYEAPKGSAAVFETRNARVAVSGLGPHNGGEPVSYALWVKTKEENAHLIHFGQIFGGGEGDAKNYIFSLTMFNGRPVVWVTDQSRLAIEAGESPKLSDNEWHHVAISMPEKSCLASELRFWIDGKRVQTKLKGPDDNLFIHTAGRISVGSLGLSGENMEDALPGIKNFLGRIDEVYVWARPINQKEVDEAMVGKKY